MMAATTLTYHEALETLLTLSTPLTNKKFVPLADALGQICAEEIICRKNLPSFNNAALDGFAIKHQDIGKKLTIKATVFAGDTQKAVLQENECYKIMTGAAVPSDADTVVAFEDTLFYDEKSVEIPANVKKGNAFRHKGEEQTRGNVLIAKNECFTPAHVAMLAAQGIMQVRVNVKPKIAVVSTGNELKEPWESATEDEIFNCNSYAIIAILKRYGFDADYCGVIPDSLGESTAFIATLNRYDVVLSSGGISMGEADFVRAALEANGFVPSFHGVNLKPGRPTMAGRMRETLVISLPGNPMAAFINTYLFAIPALKALIGHQMPQHELASAVNQKSFSLKDGRNNLVLGNLDKGKFTLTRDNKFGSGMLTPLMESNALLVSETKKAFYAEGEEIQVILL